MSKSLSSFSQYGRTSWEDADFPILCQTCLGDNPYMRMMKDKHGGECRTCERPFTTFRWCPGRGMRYKRTEICQTCAKVKNVCQTCLLDLEYGLPVQVRDYALGLSSEVVPKHGVNRQYFIQQMDREAGETDGTTPVGALAKMSDQGPNEMLRKLQRRGPYYARNLPHICSFWVKGECKRGEECPYRHEKPSDPDDPLSNQKLKDRYYGVNDPVAEKMLNRAKAMPSLEPPDDETITTLYIAGLGNDNAIGEKELREFFYQFGELRSVKVLSDKGCAFIEFTTRRAAELAAQKSYQKLNIQGRRLMVRWGKPRNEDASTRSEAKNLPTVPGLPSALPVPDFFNLMNKDSALPRAPNVPQAPRRPMTSSRHEEPAEKRGRNPFESVLGVPQTGTFRFTPMAPGQMPPSVGSYKPPRAVRRDGGDDEAGSSSSSNAAEERVRNAQTVYYPSQDPQHMGAKDLD